MSKVLKGKLVPKNRRWAPSSITTKFVVGTLGALLLVALFAPMLSTHSPNTQDLTNVLAEPSSTNFLGTDELGRDIYSRLLNGLRLSIFATLAASGIALLIGIPLGAIGGLGPRWVRRSITWLADVLFSLPAIILVLIVVGIVGKGIIPSMLGLGIAFSPVYVRLLSDELSALKSAPFVKAAKASGVSRMPLLLKHLGPSTFRPLIIQSAMTLRAAILTEAALSYLGFGAQTPNVSLGMMLKSAQLVVLDAPWQVLPPGILLFIIVLCLTLAADSFSESLNKRPSHASLVRRARGRLSPRTLEASYNGAEASPPLKIRNLSVGVSNGDFESTNLIDDVSFEVKDQEIVAVVGESGSGKTVTALASMGLLPEVLHTTGGAIEIHGQNIVDMKDSKLREIRSKRIGVVFQDPLSCMDPLQTVRENLVSPLVILDGLSKSEAEQRVLDTLQEVGVEDAQVKLDLYPHQLSGGIAQRIMIANALTSSPDILIADEPTSSLDVTVQRRVLDLFRHLKKTRGLSILIITHDMGVVAHIADKVIVLYAGRIMEQGPVDKVIHAPRHHYTDALKASLIDQDSVDRPLLVVPGNTPPPGERVEGCPFEPRCHFATNKCKEEVPLETIGFNHQVACINPPAEESSEGSTTLSSRAKVDSSSK